MIRFLWLVFGVFAFQLSINAQCGNCTIDQACVALKPKGVCDSILPDARANSAYQKDVSFFMQPIVKDAATLSACMCSYVRLDTIKFQGASNLPPGMFVEFSKPSKKYFPSQGDSTGCLRLCGSPVVAGNYVIKINFLADVLVKDISVIGDLVVKDRQESYTLYLTVLPDTSGNVSSFTYGGIRTTCDSSLTLDLEATLSAQSPNITRYFWNLANGNYSELKKPGLVTFATPDTFKVSLTTKYYNYRVKTVYVDVKDGYAGDIEEATTIQNPDPYIKFNALGFANRGSRSDVKKTSWTNLNLVVPEGTDSLFIEVWDEDTGPPQGTNALGSPDDLLFNQKIKVSLDTARFANNNVSGFVTFDTVVASTIRDTLVAVVFPKVPAPLVLSDADTFCSGRQAILKINGFKGFAFQWSNDSLAIPLANDSLLAVNESGNYSVKVTDLKTGCSNTSAAKAMTFVPSPPDSLEIVVLPDGRLVNNNYPGNAFAVQWFKNAQPIPDADYFILQPSGPGYYACRVWNKDFPSCSTTSQLFFFTSVADVATTSGISVYPNPFENEIFVGTPLANVANVLVRNVEGKILVNQYLEKGQPLNLANLQQGVYLVELQTEGTKLVKRIMKTH